MQGWPDCVDLGDWLRTEMDYCPHPSTNSFIFRRRTTLQTYSLPLTVTAAPLSPSSALVLNHISSHLLILLSDFSHLYDGRAMTCYFGQYNRYYI